MNKLNLLIILLLAGLTGIAQNTGELNEIGEKDPEETKEIGIFMNSRGEKTARLYNLIIENALHFSDGTKVDGIQTDTSKSPNDHELVTSLYVEKKINGASLQGVEKDSIALRALADTAINIRADMPRALSDLLDDSEHRTVTDNEKESWNNKLDSEVDGSITNEIQQFDVSQLIGTDLQLSLSDDGEDTKIIDLSPLQDGTGTDDQTALEVGISDAGGYFSATDVENALQELGANIQSGGDGWGSDVVHSGAAISGDGTTMNPLNIDTLNYIATKADITQGLNETDPVALSALEDSSLAIRNDIPVALRELIEDENHRTVTDAEKNIWNNKLDSEIDGSITNEIQQFDVSELIGTDLQLSLSGDGEETKVIDLSSLQDGTGTDDQTALEVGISDAGGYFSATDVENALQELGANIQSGGDGWGSDVVHSGAAISGDGTTMNPLNIDTLHYIATKADISAGLTEMDPVALSALEDTAASIRSAIPCELSELTCDPENRTVTDNEKASWNNKLEAEVDGSISNELQAFDVAQLSGTNLQLSLTNDGQEPVSIDLSPLQTQGGGDGWGTEVVNSTDLLTGDGTPTHPLSIDTNYFIATKADVQLAGNSYSPSVYLESFNGATDAQQIAAALNAIGSKERILVFGKRSYYTEGTVFPDNVVVQLPAGALIEDFCTIRGGIIAPQGSKVFNSEVDLSKADINHVYASWWGVESRTTTDQTEELNKALASFGQVIIDAGYIAVSNIILNEGDWLYGAGDMHENTNSSNYTMLMPATDNCFLIEINGIDCGIKDLVLSMTNPVDPSKVAHTGIRNIDEGGLMVDNVKIQDGQGNNGASSVDTCVAVVDSSSIYATYRSFHVVDVDHHVKTINSNQILFKDARFNCQTSALHNDPAYTVHIKDGRNILFDNCGFDVSQAHHAMTTIYVDNPTSVRLVNCYVETVQHADALFMSIGSRNARTTVDIVGMQQDQVRTPLDDIFEIRDNVGGSLNIFGGIWNSADKPVDYPGGNQGQSISNLTVNFYGMVYGNKIYSLLNYDSEKWDENEFAGEFINNANFGLSNAADVTVNTIESELTEDDSHIPTSGAVYRAINNRNSTSGGGSGWIPWTPAVMWTGEVPKTRSIKAYYQVVNNKVEFFLQVDIETGSEGVTAVALTPPTTLPETDVDIIISEDCYFDNTYPPTEGLFGYIDMSNDDAGHRVIRIPELNSEPGTSYDLKIAGWYPLNLQ